MLLDESRDRRFGDAHRRPAWMPHPGLLALIAVLWALAGVAQAVPSI